MLCVSPPHPLGHAMNVESGWEGTPSPRGATGVKLEGNREKLNPPLMLWGPGGGGSHFPVPIPTCVGGGWELGGAVTEPPVCTKTLVWEIRRGNGAGPGFGSQ